MTNGEKEQFAGLVQYSHMYISVILQEGRNCIYDVLGEPVKVNVQLCTYAFYSFIF